MNEELSILSLFLQASLVVQLVMVLLLAASIYAWTVIFQKWRNLKATREASQTFEQRFWSGVDLVDLYRQVSRREDGDVGNGGQEALFEAGFREFARLRKTGIEPAAVVEGIRRSMRVAISREVDRLETSLPLLATVGSTSPYIGLFGTVWGIMNSFRALGGVQHATLSMVAPGIAEALIATAMGLFAAIPAVIAYNRFTNEVERLVNRYEVFADEFAAIVERRYRAEAKGAEAA